MLEELNEEQIEQLIKNKLNGRMGYHVDGRVIVEPIAYSYNGDYLYALAIEKNEKLHVNQNQQVHVEVELIENNGTWQYIIAHGMYEELHGEDARRGME